MAKIRVEIDVPDNNCRYCKFFNCWDCVLFKKEIVTFDKRLPECLEAEIKQ